MVTLKQACLRLDNITNPVGNSGTKAKRTRIQDAALFSSTKNNRKRKNTDDNRNKNYKPGTKEKVWWNTCNICSKQEHHGSKCPERKYAACSGKYYPFIEYPEFKKFKEGQQKKNSDKESISIAITFFTRSIEDNNKDNDVRFVIDSGAIQHMISKKELFENLKPISKKIKVAGNSVLNTEGQRDFAIILEGSNGRTNTT